MCWSQFTHRYVWNLRRGVHTLTWRVRVRGSATSAALRLSTSFSHPTNDIHTRTQQHENKQAGVRTIPRLLFSLFEAALSLHLRQGNSCLGGARGWLCPTVEPWVVSRDTGLIRRTSYILTDLTDMLCYLDCRDFRSRLLFCTFFSTHETVEISDSVCAFLRIFLLVFTTWITRCCNMKFTRL